MFSLLPNIQTLKCVLHTILNSAAYRTFSHYMVLKGLSDPCESTCPLLDKSDPTSVAKVKFAAQLYWSLAAKLLHTPVLLLHPWWSTTLIADPIDPVSVSGQTATSESGTHTLRSLDLLVGVE